VRCATRKRRYLRFFAEDLSIRWSKSTLQQSSNQQIATGYTYHTGIHAPQTPHVQTVIILLEIHQQFRALEVPRGDSNVVFRSWMVEFCKTPIDQTELIPKKRVNRSTRVARKEAFMGGTRKHTVRFSWSIMTLCGLTSRCMIPFEWQKSRA
jgi:hypothetical protein